MPDDLYVDQPGQIEDDTQIEFPYDEDDDTEGEEFLGDSVSIGSNQRPKLRYSGVILILKRESDNKE